MNNLEHSKTVSGKKSAAAFLAALAIFFYISDIIWGISLNALPKVNIFLQIVYSIPSVVWFAYVLFLHKKENSRIIVQIIFAVFALSAMINCITGLFNIKTIMETSASTLAMLSSMFTLIIYPILQVPLFALAMYMVSNKISSAYKPIIGIVIAFIAKFIINIATNYRFISTDIVKFSLFSGVAYTLAFYLSAIVFLKHNKFSLNATNTSESFSSQQSLSALQASFDSGAITEEEYSKKRAEIINSL